MPKLWNLLQARALPVRSEVASGILHTVCPMGESRYLRLASLVGSILSVSLEAYHTDFDSGLFFKTCCSVDMIRRSLGCQLKHSHGNQVGGGAR